MDSSLEDESRIKCKVALQLILNGCDDYIILEKLLLPSSPVEMMTYILEHISKVYFFRSLIICIHGGIFYSLF